MPLPDAPPTDQSRVYREFASKTALPTGAGSITPDLLDSFKNTLFLDEFAEDELRRLLLIQLVSGAGSISGPLAGPNARVYYVSATNDGTKYKILEPSPGEVWLLGPLSFQVGGASGSVTLEEWLYAPDQIDGTARRVLVGNSSTSSSSYATIYEGGPNTPIYVDENSYVSVEASGTFTSVSFFLYAIRVR